MSGLAVRYARRWDAKLRRENYNLRLWILTFSGIAIESFVLFPAFPAALSFIASIGQSQSQAPEPVAAQVYLILYYVIPIAFSVPASLAFTPKRLVSPLNILVGAAGIYGIVFLDYLIDTQGLSLTEKELVTDVQQAIIIWVVLTGLGAIIGFGETYVVRLLVGLNGDMEALDSGVNPARKTFLIPVSFDRLSTVLEDDTNIQAWGVSTPRRRKRIITIRSYSSSDIQVILMVRPFDPNNSELVTVAYQKSFYSILQSEAASRVRDGMVRDVVGQLGVAPAIMNRDSGLSIRAANIALVPTRSALAPLSEASKFYVGLVASTLTLLGLLVAEFYIHPSSEFFASSIVAVLVAFIAEVAPTVKQYLEDRELDKDNE